MRQLTRENLSSIPKDKMYSFPHMKDEELLAESVGGGFGGGGVSSGMKSRGQRGPPMKAKYTN